MEKSARKPSLREKTAKALRLPADAVAGLPLIELKGDKELRVENHRGILAYSNREIHIGGGKIALRVRGLDLELAMMNAQELVITGQIFALELE